MVTSTEDLRGLVDRARDAVAGLDPQTDSDLRPIAFERILEALLRDTASAPSTSAPSNGGNGRPAASTQLIDDTFATEEQRIDAVASYLRIRPEQASDLFDLTSEVPRLQVNAAALEAQKRPALRQIVLLVAAARDALGIETGTADVSSAADDLDKFDRNNFINTIGAMPEVALRGKSGAHNRQVRLRLIGTEAARELASSLVG